MAGRAVVVSLSGLALILASLACGGGSPPGTDVLPDAAGDTSSPSDITPDPGTDEDARTDSGADLLDPSDAIPPDPGPDTFVDPMDLVFPGIRPECRPPDLGCTDDDECADSGRCIAGGCRPAVAARDYDFGQVRVVTGLWLPPGGTGSGFDHDLDGKPDNLLADIVATYPGGTELVNRTIAQYIDSGLYTYLAEFRQVPDDRCGPVRMAILPATGDLDLDGLPDGSGAYRVLNSGFREDGFGPIAQINTAAMDGDRVLSGPGTQLDAFIPLPDGTVLNVPLEGLRVRVNLDLGESPLRVRSVAPNAEIGGYIRLASLVAEVNAQAANCTCAGVTPDIAPAEIVQEGDVLQARCIDAFDTSSCTEATDGQVCANLAGTCTALVVLSGVLDIASGRTTTSEGDPIRDAMSVSLHALLAPAVLAEPPMAPDFAAVSDSWRVLPECDLQQDTLPTRLGVLINDFYDASVSPVIVGVTQGSAGGVVGIGSDGTHVVYTPQLGHYGFDDFTYTISDGAGNQSTAAVQVRVSVLGTFDCQADPAAFCEQYCRHEMTCDPDGVGAAWDDHEGCVDACMEGAGMIQAIDSACGQANRCMEACRIILPCRGSLDFEAAASAVESGGSAGQNAPCGNWIEAKFDACGPCGPGTYGPECLPCPGDPWMPCGPDARCRDGVNGDGVCVCDPGFTFDGEGCVDIDECALVPPACGSGAICVNYVGAFGCFCAPGEVFDPESKACIEPVSPCDPNPCLHVDRSPTRACTLDPDAGIGYRCDCDEATSWDGDLGACRSATDPCEPNLCLRDGHSDGTCQGFVEEGVFLCVCEPSETYFWDWNARRCVIPCDRLDCTLDAHSTGECVVPSMIGTPECVCEDGYFWDHRYEWCWDPSAPCALDPCSRIEHAVAGTCIPSSWSDVTCDCVEGFDWLDVFQMCLQLVE